MAPPAEVPTFIGKFFKTTSTARRLMDPNGRLCELDPDNHHRVLVYSASLPKKWDELHWSQARLYKAAQEDLTMRVSRKKIEGTYFEIFQRDFFNEPELKMYEGKPNMNQSVAAITLGHFQAKRDYVYIISKKSGG